MTARNFKTYKDTVNEYLKVWLEMCDLTIGKYSLGMTIVDSGGLFIAITVGGLFYLNGKLNFAGLIIFLLLGSVFLTSFLKIMNLGTNLAILLAGTENVNYILETKKQENDGEFKSDGDIYIDGINIKNMPLEKIMENVAFVFQDTFILNNTTYKNIILGMNRTKEEVIEACKKAQIHNFILGMENGYDTKICEDSGIKFSGGEKQRISIARAFLKNAPIILLDEATASLDVDNEYIVQQSIRKLIKGKTVLVIAHRLNTIKDSDQIIVFDKGKIIEKGRHEELIKLDGMYKKMFTIISEDKDWTI